MKPVFSPRLKEKTAEKWLAKLTSHLLPGEQVWALARTSQVRPSMDGIAVTNARLLGFSGIDADAKGAKVAVDADDIIRYEFVKKYSGPYLIVTTQTQESLVFGLIHADEIEFVCHYVDFLISTGFSAEVRDAIRTHEANTAQQAASAAQAEQNLAARRNSVNIVGSPLKDKGWITIHDHAAPGEVPWFILNNGSAGFLAAFEDRLIIAKVGGMAGFMTGALGGGRVTSFPYTDITNIEYNSGMVNGVLEILTPSYQGTANHDYWRSSNKSRNRATDDPWTLSNCLPLQKMLHSQALPRINELQRKIADAKRPQVIVHHAPQPAPAVAPLAGGLAEELQQIANLHSQGLLDAEEFAAAKRATIAKHSNP
ncbi:SHOCT domain-containing protein [Rhodococcus sp. ARC_M6]|uniref:SHOCT domain-containing protein n=1 Tax=Rhodococcus sp. ARC_M6 TaxID=2928852 RepID=UPI001FB25F58|nr:SHOCT domain-containing protein [Rhodococcus sp. ARC_M6]MCJ0907054.1 SHOCT domain-containing protein [Rhodococcus sp. ARC_M6]